MKPNSTTQLYVRNVELTEELDDLRGELAKTRLRHKQIYARVRKEVEGAATDLEKAAKALRALVKEKL